MNYVVFGGAGFLGEHLCRRLLRKGNAPLVYGRDTESGRAFARRYPTVRYVAGDFVAEEHFDAYLQRGDVVVHLLSTTLPSNTDLAWDLRSNVLATLRLLDACAKSGVRAVVFVSSGGTVYGVPRSLPLQESHATDPICSYGIQKLLIEKYLHYYAHVFQLPYRILRLANPYGAGQNPFRGQGVVAAFLARALLESPIEIWGDGSVVRDYLYIDDAMEAMEALLCYEGKETVFNVGSGRGASLQEVVAAVQYAVGRKIAVKYKAGRKQDVPVNVLDISRARQELRWQPRVRLQEGVLRMKATWNGKTRCFQLDALDGGVAMECCCGSAERGN